ncbi:hypothetical protein LguiA_015127 [Lonicera macranthoides]
MLSMLSVSLWLLLALLILMLLFGFFTGPVTLRIVGLLLVTAEYRTLADTSQELKWLRRLLDELGAPQDSTTTLYCDNRSAIQISHNDMTSLQISSLKLTSLAVSKRFSLYELHFSFLSCFARVVRHKVQDSLVKFEGILFNLFLKIKLHCNSFFTASKQTPQSSTRSYLAPSSSKSKAARRLKAFEIEQSKSSRKAQIKKENLTAKISVMTWSVVEEETGSGFGALQSSLREVCSFDDLKERMRVYLSLGSCKEIFNAMSQVTKNIDEGRLKMKIHCPIVTDVGMKEKAMRILMCFNPIWLRIGLYIIFGGDSLLPNGEVNSEQEIAFLKMVIEKQFFSHAALAKTYAYNKLVEGLYRPGYFEKLGNVILKRFLLLVLILDRAKSQSTLPINYGIDGLDGGSPPLFSLQSNIKSSRQVICDFLSSDVMHGEGNLLTHLVIVGYKVFYQQSPLIEYDFRMTDLFEDLQDGVRLCRAIQLLQHDSSILMKMVVPSDTRKKKLLNCGIALQHLKQAGVPLCDEDGTLILGEDVVSGDKELTLSLLWNIFVYMQLPLLVKKTLLSVEISKIRGVVVEHNNNNTSTLLDMLLNWIQAICQSYDFRVDNFTSLVDGKAMWCLLDYYFRMEYHCSCSSKDLNDTNGETSIMSATDYSDAVHNFILSQKLPSLLGNFPEVLQVSDILEHNGACSDRSVVILLGFLSFQLIVKRNMDQLNLHKLFGFNCLSRERRCLSIERSLVHSEALLYQEETGCNETEDTVRSFKAIMAWWQDMAKQNNKCDLKPTTPILQCFSTGRQSTDIQRENAAKTIQSHFRQSSKYCNYMRKRSAVFLLQAVIRAWLTMKKKLGIKTLRTSKVQESFFDRRKHSETFGRYMTFMVDRHDFVRLKRSTIIIQRSTRAWISTRHHRVAQSEKAKIACKENEVNNAAFRIQLAWRKSVVLKSLRSQHKAATKIQSQYRGWLERHSFEKQKQAILTIQSVFRSIKYRRDFQRHKLANRAANIIQAHAHGWIAQRRAHRHKYFIVTIQSHCRGWLIRKELLLQREAAIKIQTAFRCTKCLRAFHFYRLSAIEIQRFIRGRIIRRRLLGASCLQEPKSTGYISSSGYTQSVELKLYLKSVLMLQRWWKCILLLKSRTRSAIIIQSHIRGWMARCRASRERRRVVVIQSFWKGYCARKDSKEELMDLRLRVQKSAANVDDGMRIINRLVAALSELLSKKSVSGILHTCATLDMATQHSQKCCEELVAAGAVDTLLKLIRSVSRSIPDQEVLKHALSTLRNLARYPHLAEVLITCPGSIQTILCEFFRNKEEGYFIASALLKHICSSKRGMDAIRNLPSLKRIRSLVEELTRKRTNQRQLGREHNTERRLKEAVQLLKLITSATEMCCQYGGCVLASWLVCKCGDSISKLIVVYSFLPVET